ncbi:MAG: bifunctional hydroxymethylpyrimidine kinase/phosphomethylpyrimidine kinase [Pseudomonadota bacterium]
MNATVLTIAGSDPSGGAGVQADLQTFGDLEVSAISAVTAITAQNDQEVLAIHPTPADVLTQQLSTALKGKKVEVVKIGMVATLSNVRAIAWFLKHTSFKQVVLDPVLHSSTGIPLLETKALSIFRQQLMPLATVITPNLPEAQVLAGMQVTSLETMKKAAEVIHLDAFKLRAGINKPLYVLIKGGHLKGDAADVLYNGEKFEIFSAKRISGPSPRGTGCRFSAAIAAGLAKGEQLEVAIKNAKTYLESYIAGEKSKKHN